MAFKFGNLIKSCCALTDKLTRSVGRALSTTPSNEDHQQLAYKLPRTYQTFYVIFFKFLLVIFLFDSQQNWTLSDILSVFRNFQTTFQTNFPKTSWPLQGKALINQLLVLLVKYSDLILFRWKV